MARPRAATIDRLTPPHRRTRGFSFNEIPVGIVEIPSLLDGMVTAFPRDQIPNGAATLAQNARVRDGWLGRRPGTSTVGTKPDSDKVLKVVTYISPGGTVRIVRITADSVYWTTDGDNWHEMSGSLPGATTRVQTAQLLGRLYVVSPSTKVHELDFDANTVTELEDAPKGLTITAFAERIIVGNIGVEIGGLQPEGIKWCGNSEPTIWDAVDDDDEITGAGEENLLVGSDSGDHIAGLFGLLNTMVILRRRSIWTATRQPSAVAPFRFQQVISGTGSDLPYTAVAAEGVLIFADQASKAVYAFSPGQRPEDISRQIRDQLMTDIQALKWAEAVYDPFEKEYHLGLVLTEGETTIEKTWVYSLINQAWTLDDSPDVSTLGVVSLPGGTSTIDDLSPDTIDGLSPTTIDDLSGQAIVRPQLMKGTDTGEVIRYDFSELNDWDASAFEFIFQSPNLGSLQRRRVIKDLMVILNAVQAGDVVLEHSNDGSTWTNTKTVAVDGRVRVALPKTQITGDDLYWRLRSSDAEIRLHSWWMRMLEKYVQRQS